MADSRLRNFPYNCDIYSHTYGYANFNPAAHSNAERYPDTEASPRTTSSPDSIAII
jgi:hypothetical protein